ncbi:hypothetical protein Tco_0365849 [Tanacetum coccineum]
MHTSRITQNVDNPKIRATCVGGAATCHRWVSTGVIEKSSQSVSYVEIKPKLPPRLTAKNPPQIYKDMDTCEPFNIQIAVAFSYRHPSDRGQDLIISNEGVPYQCLFPQGLTNNTDIYICTVTFTERRTYRKEMLDVSKCSGVNQLWTKSKKKRDNDHIEVIVN